MSVVLKFDGNHVGCTQAACSKDALHSGFVASLASKFMSTDLTMDEAFKATKVEFAAKQIEGVALPKLSFSDVASEATPQTVANVIQSSGGRSA